MHFYPLAIIRILVCSDYSKEEELLTQIRKFKFDSLLFEIYQNHDIFSTIHIIKMTDVICTTI